MTQTRKIKLGDLAATIRKDVKTLRKRAIRAAHKTAQLGRLIVYSKAPVAFAELRDSIVWEGLDTGSRIRSLAPHSASVEAGSRPHMPPIAPLIAWVRLRGAQGIDSGSTATGKPARVAASIAAHGDGSSTPVDAAERVAWAIALSIKKHGTKPTWFMQRSLPEIESLLNAYVHSIFDEPLPEAEEPKPATRSAVAPSTVAQPAGVVKPKRVGPPRARDERGKFLKAAK